MADPDTAVPTAVSLESAPPPTDSVLPIIQKASGGVYISNVHVSSLRGLAAWQDSAAGWTLTARTGSRNGSSSSATGTSTSISAAWPEAGLSGAEGSFTELGTQRRQITAKNVLLALHLEELLRGDLAVPSDASPEDLDRLARVWYKRDKAAQLSLAAANPQASHAHKRMQL